MSQKKVIALLDLTGPIEGANYFVSSLNYFWTLYPNFVTFEIVDNKQNIEYTIELLDKYYQEGYRVFFGPLISTVLVGVFNWFEIHPDVIGITPVSDANSLIFPKNYFRLQPSDFYFINFITTQVNPATSNVYYFYNTGQLASADCLTKIQSSFTSNIYTYPVTTNSSLNVTDVQSFFTTNGITTNDIVIVYLSNLEERNKYFNLFNDITIGNVKQYDVQTVTFPQVSNDVTNLYGNYYCILTNNLNSTSILNNTINDLRSIYAVNTLTSLYLLTLFANNENIDNAYSYGEVVPWFDDNNGIKYWSYCIYVYDSNGFTKTNIYLNDPSYGILTFNKKV
jgi:hypothetical protein